MAQKVLIVEDDDALRAALSEALLFEGYQIEAAANGLEAIGALRKDPSPCLVIADLMMPIMNGWELYEQMQADSTLRAYPIIFLSAFSGKYAPTASYLSKPLDLNRLMNLVRERCGSPN